VFETIFVWRQLLLLEDISVRLQTASTVPVLSVDYRCNTIGTERDFGSQGIRIYRDRNFSEMGASSSLPHYLFKKRKSVIVILTNA
jgi:hypothetical protein